MIRWAILLSFMLAGMLAFSQENPAERKQLVKGLIEYSKYTEALALLRNSRELRYTDKEGHFLMALCHYQLNQLDEAEALLMELTRETRDVFPETWLYLGKIFHARHQFSEAAQYYKTYLRAISHDDPSRPMIIDELRRCATGIQLQYRPGEAFVENLGPAVNTPGDEFGAVPSANFQTRFYFSSCRPGNIGGPRNAFGQTDERYGQYYSDIYSAQNEEGVWRNVQPLHYLLNSPRHEMILDFNESGSAMYYYQGNDWFGGAIMVDTFRQAEERVLSSDPFPGPAESTVEQAAPHFVDAQTVIFPSRRPGGYGGFDLYISVRNNGKWSEPENLGPAINSIYDETTPFLARDGRTLYFSSNNRDRSMGGYDIFRALYLAETDRWVLPENLGLPINSAGDDTHFRLGNDGISAFFTSSRKDGFGQRDLYIAYFNDFREEQEPPLRLTDTYYQQFRQAPSPAPIPRAGEGSRLGDVLFDPIPFNGQADLLSTPHRAEFDRLAGLLTRDPSTRLLATVFTGPGTSVSESLYWAVQEVMPVVDLLLGRGVSPASIALYSALADPASFAPGARAIITWDLQGSTGSLAANRGGAPRAVVTPLAYRLQIAAMRGAFTGNFMDELPLPMVEKAVQQPICYYLVGGFRTFAEAEEQRRALAAQGIIGQIVPYIDGWRATEQAVLQQVNRLPDLRNYLER